MSEENTDNIETTERERSCPTPTCSVPVRLLENLLDNTRQLRAENHWWKDEPRMYYRANYAQLCAEIKEAEDILSRSSEEPSK